MTTSRITERPHVLFCSCAHYEVIPRASKEQILTSLSQVGVEVEAVDDFCGLAANRDPRLPTWAAASSLAVVACFPRAIHGLFRAAGTPLSNDRVRFFNMRTQSPEEILQALMKDDGSLMIADESTASASPNHQSSIVNHQSQWVPWFPVIDYDRCRNCKQCLNFCLFGVYRLSPEGKVMVQNPAGCKTNCPACARMCPQKAIIFPKYAEAPINGEELSVPSSQFPVDRALTTDNRPLTTGNDLYDRIRQRGAARKRFSTEPKEGGPGPSCPTLEGLRRELGIPNEVLASLSPAQLQRAIGQRNPHEVRPGPGPSDSGKDKKHDG